MNLQLRWNQRYAIRSYVNSALWIVPFIAVIAEQVLVRLASALRDALIASGFIDPTSLAASISASGARSIYETVITATLSFLVFTFGSLLVAIQVAGGQYTPRVIVTVFLRDKVVRACVGLFIIALLLALRALRELGDTVLQFSFILSALFGLVSVGTFLFLIDYAARMLRPISIAARVGGLGLAVVQSVYPQRTVRPSSVTAAASRPPPERTVQHTGTSGVVLAVNLDGLVALAQKSGGSIEFIPQVGDFLAVDEPLFHLRGAAASLEEGQLRATVALGTERTMEQDPTFAFRILVDIAIKALSAAINDPTTAVLAIDQLHRLLRLVGLRQLRTEEYCDQAGELRLILRTPNWEDFVHLTCTEIRHCGATSIQIPRRLRSMLENLMQTLPPHRHAELRQQLALLDRTVEESYKFREDAALARIADSQGLGGALGVQAMSEVPQ